MTNVTTAAPNRNIKEILNSGDIGGIVQANKKLFILLFILVTASVIGYGLYTQVSEQKSSDYNSEIYKFDQGLLKKFTETGADAKVVVAEFSKLHGTVKNYSGLFPISVKLSDSLMAHKNLEEALEVLKIGSSVASNEYNNYFVLARMAVVYEDLNQDQKAIETLEKMNSASFKVFEGKIYLDLGRLYLKTGNKEKAKMSFQYVVDKAHDEAEFVKVAKLYLAKI
jgi:predicted negative regulator of RcsB-dependent stress response